MKRNQLGCIASFSDWKMFLVILILPIHEVFSQYDLVINSKEYFESPSTDVLVFTDSYSEGHQGGIQIIHHGQRIAANGDLKLEPTPGQWQAFSQLNEKSIDSSSQIISVSLSYPNEKAASRKFNPISYPDFDFAYQVSVKSEGESFRIIVNLEKPLPKEWLGKVGFNLELFPGDLFGKKYYMDKNPGIFPMQLSSPFIFNKNSGKHEVSPLATGKKLSIAPEETLQHLSIESMNTELQLIDGRTQHNNGWFVVRSLIPKDASEKAIEWVISPSLVKAWMYGPVLHINQAGYLPSAPKRALIECDSRLINAPNIKLIQISDLGEEKILKTDSAKLWGKYQRYKYYEFDFSEITEEGVYYIEADTLTSETFKIAKNNYEQGVWQPTLEYFLPVQMCHMRVNDRYRVWHGLCHMDDARMAPTDHVHFDGYWQEGSTLCSYKSGEHVPNLNSGGWHDAGDYDLRVESQGGTVYSLSLIHEAFKPELDITTVDQKNHLVEMHLPDGKPDILQQIEHGTISIVKGNKELGRLYRGIICNDLRQYVMLGDGSTMTDNVIFNEENSTPEWLGKINDDRWVFTEINPRRELQVCAYLAAASRSLRGFNDTLSSQSLEIAEALWQNNAETEFDKEKVIALVELILSTEEQNYIDLLTEMHGYVAQHVPETGWAVARVLNKIPDMVFQRGYMLGIQKYYQDLNQETGSNPFGVPYQPRIWGSAWGIERFGVEQYYIHTILKVEDAKKYLLNALDYTLGIHPGENTVSLVSGVGTSSATVAYGINRADWSYIPGGVISGPATIKPDFPELKNWPFLWQQTEYVIGGAAANFMFLVLGAKEVLK